MNQRLLALYGLKWNPFSPELPTEAIYVPPRLENFCWRIEHAQIREGGFAMIHGDPGTGKSVALRLLSAVVRNRAYSAVRTRLRFSGSSWLAPSMT
jgi:type II secretory pathway predicted ATPase ExeA